MRSGGQRKSASPVDGMMWNYTLAGDLDAREAFSGESAVWGCQGQARLSQQGSQPCTAAAPRPAWAIIHLSVRFALFVPAVPLAERQKVGLSGPGHSSSAVATALSPPAPSPTQLARPPDGEQVGGQRGPEEGPTATSSHLMPDFSKRTRVTQTKPNKAMLGLREVRYRIYRQRNHSKKFQGQLASSLPARTADVTANFS